MACCRLGACYAEYTEFLPKWGYKYGVRFGTIPLRRELKPFDREAGSHNIINIER